MKIEGELVHEGDTSDSPSRLILTAEVESERSILRYISRIGSEGGEIRVSLGPLGIGERYSVCFKPPGTAPMELSPEVAAMVAEAERPLVPLAAG